ncbi:uridine diphosphate glucose pyrophosphatase NUDT14 isoform X2 [Physeter macrocephalus]|uniref:Uridine diphosphate glucose pyrophosphatase NUDT14 isoform X2 n=1 Tax=Physeter macrocephalus TaxID=9755 RepID=A0A455C8D0_PHYMC|nr:uridine diphosphate glucose pyrophosphatase NUDT14 isoform X2 [Physeter catodon]|eukprot:XP_028352276.1 uridine diphosphate glucose pyrophosphatase isoform X2 [Physeter catodon]
MERIEGAAVGRCAASPYLLPLTLHCRQNGTQKSWDFMKTHDSVTILVFNSSRRSLVLVKQFRPAVCAGGVERLFAGSLAAVGRAGPRELQPALPGSAGPTFELCAGLVDQPALSLEEVACKEAWEECGYRLAPSGLRRVATYKIPPSSPDLTSSHGSLITVWCGTDQLQPDHVLRRGDSCPAGWPRRGPGRGGRAHRGCAPAPGWRPGLRR